MCLTIGARSRRTHVERAALQLGLIHRQCNQFIKRDFLQNTNIDTHLAHQSNPTYCETVIMNAALLVHFGVFCTFCTLTFKSDVTGAACKCKVLLLISLNILHEHTDTHIFV